MSRVKIPLNEGMVQRLDWLCQYHQLPLSRVYLISKPYYFIDSNGLSGVASAFTRRNSIFLFPPVETGAESLDRLSRKQRIELAKCFAHEFMHFIENHSLWILCPYPKLRLRCREGKTLSPAKRFWARVMHFFTYDLNPREIRANWHSFRHWKKYYFILWGKQLGYLGMVDWLVLFTEWRTNTASLSEAVSELSNLAAVRKEDI